MSSARVWSIILLTGIGIGAIPVSAQTASGISQEAALAGQVARFQSLRRTESGHRELGSLLKRSLFRYDKLKDYRALFRKTELSAEGTPDEPETILLKFSKPWKIYMGWLDTRKKGLQVVYERGKHDGKLAIHQPGLFLGLAQVIFLDQNSPWVKEGSASYNIEDAGIGTFLTDYTKAVLRAGQAKKLTVTFKDGDSGPEGIRVETVFDLPDAEPDIFARRIVTVFDPKTALPVYMELYDWQDRRTGIYHYDDLYVNVGPEDAEFKKHINRRLLRVYEGG